MASSRSSETIGSSSSDDSQNCEDSYDWVHQDVLRASSSFNSPEACRAFRNRVRLTRGEATEPLVDLFPVGPSERVCWVVAQTVPDPGVPRVFGQPWELAHPYFFMYSDFFERLGVRLPFTDFEAAILKMLDCAPSQLHFSGWACLRAFEVVCEVFRQVPSPALFFHLFRAQCPSTIAKVRWLELYPHGGQRFFVPFSELHGGFERRFFKVTSGEGAPIFFLNGEGVPEFPLQWVGGPAHLKWKSPTFRPTTFRRGTNLS